MTGKLIRKRRKWPWVVGGLLAALIAFPYIAVLIATGTSGIVHRFEPIRGRVVDDKTGAPLDGAVVVAVYIVSLPSVGGEVARAVEAGEAITTSNGEFEIPSKYVFGSLYPGAWFNESQELYAIRTEYSSLNVRVDLNRMKNSDIGVTLRLKSNTEGIQDLRRLHLPYIMSSDGTTLLENKIKEYLEIYQQERKRMN
ncbi:MAG TPA: carboxypeptidase-like regulatory domain-containing protein [Geobacteraceae bacterium]